MSAVSGAPVVLVPPRRQALWGWPAVVNFALGGLGAGYYAVAALAAAAGAAPAAPGWLGPSLVLAGFAAVAAEAGRPLRGPRVLRRVHTSWMSRELWLGAAFAALAVADWASPHAVLRAGAVGLAVALAVGQGCVLREARGVAAWSVRSMPQVFAASALVSGAGLWMVLAAARGERPGRWATAALIAALLGALGVWVRYLGSSEDPAFADGVRMLADGPVGRALVTGGYLAPAGLLALGAVVPQGGAVLAALAGAAMLAAQAYAKAALVLDAGRLRPLTLAGVRVHRRLT